MTTAKQPTEIKDLPTPKGHLLLGHLPEFHKTANKHQVLERWVEECGELYRIHFAGMKLIVSANPQLNHKVLKLRPEKFRRLSKMAEIIEEMGVLSVFNAEGETWRRHRIPIARALNARRIRTFHPVLRAKTGSILKKLSDRAATGEKVAVQEEFMLFTIDVTTSIAFGYEMDMINQQQDEFQDHLKTIFPMINERISAPLPVWRVFKQEKDRKLETSLKVIEGIVHRFINEARERIKKQPELRENPTNLLESLLVDKEAHNFSDKDIYSNVFTMLLAGEDTTSNSISWAVFYLAQHPDLVRKIREEAIAVYNGEDVAPSQEHLSRLVYTHAVVQEALRIKPTSPQLYLESNEEVVLENLRIPKNTRIILQNKVAQTEAQYFTRPHEFLPERWLESECPVHQNHSPDLVKTFGAGPRFCPGKYLAINEMLILLSALCKQFDFRLAVDPQEVNEQFEFTMYPENLWIEFTPVGNDVPSAV
ncbi:cytochrome P450 [Flavilitoribacter nigricans]|uniref:Cytochrome P450 n=1 Tax=Flavilitoribacter nigricans (strain ATCC 23147 / DSM 23189 / NBRC 102662 / NCIMB 1420 / SS-2) TaxID=1122177 RepID=A0A2D0NIG1_FLAN2|nr:cytochrome P450 [Flavilitoribacter nigricans]PHN08228.1 hypothetical protein CRP01_02585 [Flavilitoribacter nigricans DSM 23189 = NBRC 102662]